MSDKKSKSSGPIWKLNDNWAVGLDPRNWTLLQLTGKDKKIWKPVGFYPTPESLFKSLARKIARTEPECIQTAGAFETHVYDAYSECIQAAGAFEAHLREILGDLASCPPARAVEAAENASKAA